MLKLLFGNVVFILFVMVFLFVGILFFIIVGMVGGSIFVGIYKEFYDIKGFYIKVGIIIILVLVIIIIFFINNLF